MELKTHYCFLVVLCQAVDAGKAVQCSLFRLLVDGGQDETVWILSESLQVLQSRLVVIRTEIGKDIPRLFGKREKALKVFGRLLVSSTPRLSI